MNELGTLLVGSIVRCTLVAALGVFLVVALRRRGPVIGATIAATTLVVLVGVSGLALAPWPRWWTVGSGADGVRPPGRSAVKSAATSGRAPALPPLDAGPVVAGPEPAPASESWSRGVAGEIVRVLLSVPRPQERTTQRWNWLAYGTLAFIAGLVFGLARLLLGVRGVQRLRQRARSINDAGLLELMASLCATMGRRRVVALLESDEVASPATVGWRRPAVILPPGWREWDEQERRVVVAHELAHVCRGDYPVALAAQFSLALHFYHPLVYWLAARLRLEQELAADAWGAAVVGGNQRYLATLARFALRESDRPASWPARAFFSTRGTLLRRIEMLRDPNTIRHGAPPRRVRALMITTLAAAGLLVAGFRGPEAPESASAQTPARAQEKGPVIARPAPAEFDLAYVPSDAVLVFAARPAEFLGLPGYEPLTKLTKDAELVPAAFPVSPLEIEQIVVVWLGDDPAGAAVTRPRPGQRLATVQRTNKPQDWAKAIVESVGEVEKVPFEGREYLRLKQPRGDYCAYTPDDRTLLTAGEDVLRDLIRRGPDLKAGHAWDPSWESVKRCQFAIAGNQAGLRLWMGNPGLTALQVSAFSPFFEKTRTFALGAQAGKGLALDGLATCASAADARQVGETCQAALTLARNLMRDLHAQPKPGQAMPSLFALNGLIDPLLNAARIDVRDQGERSLVRLTAAPPDLDAGEVIKLFLPAFAASRAATLRSQGINNLKQIGLAMHNYEAAHGHFPPAVVIGPDGKTPHSWRVELLPLIGREDLYSQYKLDEPWDGPNNRKLLDKVPSVYHAPNPGGDPIFASYFVPTGPDTVFPGAEGTKFAAITDGTVNTIMLVEARRAIPWTKPEDISIDVKGPLPEFGGYNVGGFSAAFGDGSVRFLSFSINKELLRALFTKAGGEVIQLP